MVVLALGLLAAGPAQAAAGYLPLRQDQLPHITDLVLIYQGGGQRPQWTLERFAPYVSYQNTRGGSEQWLFDSFLFIEFADRKLHAFQRWPGVPAAQKADWLALLEKNFAADDGVPNLEKCCAAVAGRIGPPSRLRRVILTLPEPFAGQTNWGSLNGWALDFRKPADRLKALAWYMEAALKKWKELSPRYLELAGFYWGPEGSRTTNSFLPQVAELVHARGKQFFWIPYWARSGTQRNWRAFGFDAAWQQPNHFFHPEVPDSRLDEACRFARRYGMGLEMEFDARMLSQPKIFERRFDAYLDAFIRNSVEQNSSIAYYEGGVALYQLATSKKPGMRAHYDRLAHFILNRQKLAAQQPAASKAATGTAQ